jgi:hypothetical protein
MTFSQNKRLFEVIPGALIWITLICSVLLSVIRPLWMVYFIILFDLYWLFRIFYFTPFLISSWWEYRQALKRDWQAEAERLPGYKKVGHVIFLPFVKEPVEVIRETLHSLSRCRYPARQMVIVLAGEGRYAEHYREVVTTILPEFAETFRAILTTQHPPGLPDEIPGKGSNLNYSGHAVLPELRKLGFDPDWTVVSSFDVDTMVHPQYFSCVTYRYLTISEPTRSSYQPVALYNNNLWESPAVVRVAMFGTTFWLLQELARPEGMMTFASHSMSLRMLIDVDFWQKDIVSEDSRIFLQAFVRYHGEYRVTPIHLPVSMDTVMAGNYWKALPALYKQLRRWAWGMENFPFMMATIWRDKTIPLTRRFMWVFKQVEGGYTWATASLIIFLVGYLPFWMAPDSFHAFAVFQNTPFTLQWLMRLSMLGLFVSAALSLTLLPPPPAHLPRPYAYLIGIIQWAMLPVSFVLFGALPAIDAQTRLMLNRPLGFNVSPKRKST